MLCVGWRGAEEASRGKQTSELTKEESTRNLLKLKKHSTDLSHAEQHILHTSGWKRWIRPVYVATRGLTCIIRMPCLLQGHTSLTVITSL